MNINKVYDGPEEENICLTTFCIMNGQKLEDALSVVLLNFALEYVNKKVQVDQEDFKLNRHTSAIVLG